MTNETINKILSLFGIKHSDKITQVYKSAWNIDDKYILKRNTDTAHLEKNILISSLLIEKNLPVARFYKTTEGKDYVFLDDAYYSLMDKINGHYLDPYSGNTYENGKMLGKIVAALHIALKDLEDKVEYYDAHCIRELDGWIKDEIEKNNIVFADGLIEDCYAFKELYESLPRQLIHRDMHLWNLMFDNNLFTGYLDFEISQKNVRIFDICYLGASMLVDKYQDPERVKAWKEIFRGVIDGYQGLSMLSENEKDAFHMMFVMIEVIFSAFFAKLGQKETSDSCVDMTNWLYKNKALLEEVRK
jgi:Ser/Thr protein kinase RdoA (MazF antagonist)